MILWDYPPGFSSGTFVCTGADDVCARLYNRMWASADEEMSIQEAIQLSLALEESERYAKEEAAARSKLQVLPCSVLETFGFNACV